MKADKSFLGKKTAIGIYPVLLIAVLFLSSCTMSQIKMDQLPLPPPTAKLRVHVVAVTSDTPPAGFWKVSPEEYVANMVRQTGRMLRNRGMYEVVPAADIKHVMGDLKIAGWEWMNNNWALAKETGKALHADYVLCLERSWKNHLQQEMTLFNLHTGRHFSVANYLPNHWNSNDRAATEIILINYRILFRDAQSDLLQTALRKGRGASGKAKQVSVGKDIKTAETAKADVPAKPRDVVIPKEETQVALPAPRPLKAKPQGKQMTVEEKQLAFEKEMEAALSAKNKKQGIAHLVVYDFDTIEQLKVVGMILTEALREELHKLGDFTLVNRENMVQVMEELKLQQSGLVNEKQAIKLGEWMAANEAVTGHFAVIGKSSILQAKRVDIKTLGTMALGSIKCKTGEEDDLLGSMPDLAQKLAQLKKN